MTYRQDQPTIPQKPNPPVEPRPRRPASPEAPGRINDPNRIPPRRPGFPPQPPRPVTTPRAAILRRDRRGQYRMIRRRHRPGLRITQIGCLSLAFVLICLVLTSAIYVIAPGRTNVLLIGNDYADPGNYVSRTDTIMLATFAPRKPTVSILSIPRDLWVTIPGVGENRINTAHFFAESRHSGSGPKAVEQTIQSNFGVPMDYYLRIRFEGFRELVDAFGGVDITLSEPMAGYSAGRVHLTGRKALAFVRDRANADDFFRMSHGQLMLKALFLNALNPFKWPRLPFVASAFYKVIDTDIPFWMWPRFGLMLLLSGPNGIYYQVLPRQMTTPYLTDSGANVLLPKWELIHLLVKQVFSPG